MAWSRHWRFLLPDRRPAFRGLAVHQGRATQPGAKIAVSVPAADKMVDWCVETLVHSPTMLIAFLLPFRHFLQQRV
ncbi:hypothetical protein A6A04_17540 [Paramagnetospirillum marisnigri]|uniref:Uncharacterized protein n=1 Tax=Paramagnetospirillum marisnigri TaxID=1285242 RepID=A0A178MPL1_9PROT|nr:hypothetical protein A6A04_17540 [Paramagnetospirillum marisnigri]